MPRRFVWHPGTRARNRRPKAPRTEGKVEIRQVRSGIGQSCAHAATLEALGLRHHQEVTHPGLRRRWPARSSECVTW